MVAKIAEATIAVAAQQSAHLASLVIVVNRQSAQVRAASATRFRLATDRAHPALRIVKRLVLGFGDPIEATKGAVASFGLGGFTIGRTSPARYIAPVVVLALHLCAVAAKRLVAILAAGKSVVGVERLGLAADGASLHTAPPVAARFEGRGH